MISSRTSPFRLFAAIAYVLSIGIDASAAFADEALVESQWTYPQVDAYLGPTADLGGFATDSAALLWYPAEAEGELSSPLMIGSVLPPPEEIEVCSSSDIPGELLGAFSIIDSSEELSIDIDYEALHWVDVPPLLDCWEQPMSEELALLQSEFVPLASEYAGSGIDEEPVVLNEGAEQEMFLCAAELDEVEEIRNSLPPYDKTDPKKAAVAKLLVSQILQLRVLKPALEKAEKRVAEIPGKIVTLQAELSVIQSQLNDLAAAEAVMTLYRPTNLYVVLSRCYLDTVTLGNFSAYEAKLAARLLALTGQEKLLVQTINQLNKIYQQSKKDVEEYKPTVSDLEKWIPGNLAILQRP